MPRHTGNRLTVSIPGHMQKTLEEAADLAGTTLAQFVVQAALEKAEGVLASDAPITLTRRESLRLLELLENPPLRNEAFVQAQARYERTKKAL